MYDGAIERVVDLYHRGVYSRLGFCVNVFAHLTPENLSVVLQLPSDELAELRAYVDGMPTTDEGWAQVNYLQGGTFDHDPDSIAQRKRQDEELTRRARRGVELFREHVRKS